MRSPISCCSIPPSSIRAADYRDQTPAAQGHPLGVCQRAAGPEGRRAGRWTCGQGAAGVRTRTAVTRRCGKPPRGFTIPSSFGVHGSQHEELHHASGLHRPADERKIDAVPGRSPASKPPPTTFQGEQLAVVRVPDARLEWLNEIYKPKKKTEATIECLDVPGFSHETARLAGRVPQEPGGAAAVRCPGGRRPGVRQPPACPPTAIAWTAQADLAELAAELAFCDLEQVTTRIDRLEKSLKKPTKTHEHEKRELELMKRCQTALESEQPISTALTSDEDRKMLTSFAFLTELPIIVVINVNEADAAKQPPFEYLHAHTDHRPVRRDRRADRPNWSRPTGLRSWPTWASPRRARDRLVRACYDAVGLLSFLTAGEDEVRAWSIKRGSDAVEAASKIPQ